MSQLRVTEKWLKEMGIHGIAVERFRETFARGAVINKANLQRLGEGPYRVRLVRHA